MCAAPSVKSNLGCLHSEAGDYERACKHFVISARAGYELSLKGIKYGYEDGFITKDEYSEILRAYQKKQEDMKSKMRDECPLYKAYPELYWDLLAAKH